MRLFLRYNLRSMFARWPATLMTVASIAFVVLVFVGVLAMASGLGRAFTSSGEVLNVIVLREGARSETESYFSVEKHRQLAALPGVLRGAGGEVLASGEVLHLQIFERRDGTESNVAVRGVGPAAFALRPRVRLVEGRRFEPGTGEVIVGRNLAGRFPGLELGEEVFLGRLRFRVVGIFEAGGSSFDSEIWGAVQDFGDAFRRDQYYSSSLLRTASIEEARALIARIEADQRLKLAPMLETEYYETQVRASTQPIFWLGAVLAVLMAFGTCFAAANTMYSHVAARSREIGTMRALGFRRFDILASFLLEAAFLGLVSGVVGALLSLPLNGISTGTTNMLGFSEIAFMLRTTPRVLASGVVLAVVTGLVGGFLPAWSAARRPVAALLRAG